MGTVGRYLGAGLARSAPHDGRSLSTSGSVGLLRDRCGDASSADGRSLVLFSHGGFHLAWPISMPFVGSMGCTPEVREQAGTAMVRQLVRSDRAVTVRAPSSHPVGDDGRKHNGGSMISWKAGRARHARHARCDGDPAIRFCSWQVVSRTGCRAGCAVWKHAGVDVDAHLHGLIGCRTGAAAGGA